MTGAVDPLRFNAHPDTWLVVALSAFAYWYALRRLGPRKMAGGGPVASRRQVTWFAAGLVVLWIASDWPIHDLAERYLFSAHMVEHLLISLVAPPMLLLGLPDWLIRRILRPRWAGGSVRVLGRPVVAAVVFNVFIATSHAPFFVDATLTHHFLHFWAHLLLFTVAMLMWFPVVNHLPELPTLSAPGKMIYLFLQSVIPNVPAAFLAFATSVVYGFYAGVSHPVFGLDAVSDQQLAAAIMKVGGTFVIWGVIVYVFFGWAAGEHRNGSEADDRAASAAAGVAALAARRAPASGPRPDDMPEVLTWEDVQEALARSQPARPGP